MFNLIKGIGYITLIGLAAAAALISGQDNQRPGRIVEDEDQPGYWWEEDAEND